MKLKTNLQLHNIKVKLLFSSFICPSFCAVGTRKVLNKIKKYLEESTIYQYYYLKEFTKKEVVVGAIKKKGYKTTTYIFLLDKTPCKTL